ncbi:unnamed protein product [Sphenostylis stenocarpa]|uniref:Uncharacterized protein n=1 Tax=Sphenostylis stenocarpa TaxID=92480 RepID=A0AA86RTC9_9FABA|nr:unnamed protein product [Sphenostylis stenocarpa]
MPGTIPEDYIYKSRYVNKRTSLNVILIPKGEVLVFLTLDLDFKHQTDPTLEALPVSHSSRRITSKATVERYGLW